jgi:CRP/FNR family cyclic AMP-dependent transcriptional regulator
MIGATRQAISLALNRLQDEGVITAQATTMVVNDIAALRREAGH